MGKTFRSHGPKFEKSERPKKVTAPTQIHEKLKKQERMADALARSRKPHSPRENMRDARSLIALLLAFVINLQLFLIGLDRVFA